MAEQDPRHQDPRHHSGTPVRAGITSAGAPTPAARTMSMQALYGVEVDREPAHEGSGRRQPEPGSPVGEVLASPAVTCFLRPAGTVLGREITRGLFGTARRRR